jgi:hypothetical protein
MDHEIFTSTLEETVSSNEGGLLGKRKGKASAGSTVSDKIMKRVKISNSDEK